LLTISSTLLARRLDRRRFRPPGGHIHRAHAASVRCGR
jgi:hypothetical protein